METYETKEIKKFLKQRLYDVKSMPYDKKLVGWHKKREEAKREGFINGMEAAISLIENIEKLNNKT